MPETLHKEDAVAPVEGTEDFGPHNYGGSRPIEERAQQALSGNALALPSDIGRTLIELMRSSADLSSDTRELLAQALERGLNGSRTYEMNDLGRHLPRLCVQGLDRDGRVSDGVNKRRLWMDAAEDVGTLRSKGERGDKPIIAIAEKYCISSDLVRKAIKFRNRFHAELDNPESEVVAKTLNFWGDNEFYRDNEDHYYFARSLFIEREAGYP